MPFAEMLPGDCEECGSTSIEITREGDVRIVCRSCGHVELMQSPPRMETFEEMLRGVH